MWMMMKATSTSSMTDILSEAINSRKQSNEIRNKQLDMRKEEVKQQHLFQQNLYFSNNNKFSSNNRPSIRPCLMQCKSL